MTAADPEEISYRDAVEELEALLARLDEGDTDVDALAATVRRAAELIRICRARIAGARVEVERVVAELEADASPDPPSSG